MSPFKIKMMLAVYALSHPDIDFSGWDSLEGVATRNEMIDKGYMTTENKPTDKLASWVAFVGTMAGELDDLMNEPRP